MFKTIAISAALALASFGSANAATIVFTATPLTDVANQAADSFSGTYAENVTDSIGGVRRSIWEGTALNGIGVFTSITGSATYSFVRSSVLKFIWGSPDAYNAIDFYNNGVFVETVTVGGPYGLNVPNSFASITTVGLFDEAVFKSGTPAFEIGNLTSVAAVPLPAAGFLLLGALGGISALRRRKAG